MALTGRLVLVALVATLVVGVSGSVLAVLVVDATLVAAALLDAAYAGSVRALRLERAGDTSVRLGESAQVVLRVANPGRRPVRGLLRDAWPPSAGAVDARQRIDV